MNWDGKLLGCCFNTFSDFGNVFDGRALWLDLSVRAGKTGFVSKSGYCLATLLRLPQNGQQVAVVVLGARSNAGRFLETQNLFNWLSAKASTVFATRTPLGLTQQQQQQQQ